VTAAREDGWLGFGQARAAINSEARVHGVDIRAASPVYGCHAAGAPLGKTAVACRPEAGR
jgi:hypothetical protein